MVYRPDLDNSPPSPASNPSRMKKPVHKTASVPYSRMNPTRLIRSQVVLTVGEIRSWSA